MQGTRFTPPARVGAETRLEQRIWAQAGPIISAVRTEEDILRAERAAYARTGVHFVSCVWDAEDLLDEPAPVELLRWDIVKGDVWVIYQRAAGVPA